MVGAATAKLRVPKHVRTRGTDSKLESDERKLLWFNRHPFPHPSLGSATALLLPMYCLVSVFSTGDD